MRKLPLIRIKLSNEHISSLLAGVLLLYLLPGLPGGSQSITGLAAALGAALAADILCNFIRFKQPICAVSAAVTACIVLILCPGAPLLVLAGGSALAIIGAKHLFGGTGKNILNPAITAVLLISLFYPVKPALLDFSPLYLPALILSLPFLFFRPCAGAAVMAAAGAALAAGQNVPFGLVLFFACVIVTDPVTVSAKPAAGAAFTFIAFFGCLMAPALFTRPLPALCTAVLVLNIFSFIVDRLFPVSLVLIKPRLSLKKLVLPYTGAPDRITNTPDSTLSGPELLHRIEQGAITGRGGGAFPLIQKLKAVLAADKPGKYLVVNAVECDPGLVHDRWLLTHYSREILQGITYLNRCVMFKRIILAVKPDYTGSFPGQEMTPPVELVKVGAFYPAGEEKTLVNRVLKDTLAAPLPPGTLPAREGILVCNLQTVHAAARAVREEGPVATRFITAADLFSHKSKVIAVRPGENIHELIQREFGQKGPVFKGGGAMQAQQAKTGDLIEENTNFIAVGPMPHYKESFLCSRCGLCTLFCPQSLPVQVIADLIDQGKPEKAARYHPERCFQCGLCSYICLAGRNLSHRLSR